MSETEAKEQANLISLEVNDRQVLMMNEILTMNLTRAIQQMPFVQSPEAAQGIHATVVLTTNAKAAYALTIYAGTRGEPLEIEENLAKYIALLALQQKDYFQKVTQEMIASGEGIDLDLQEQKEALQNLIDTLPEVEYNAPQESSLVGADGNPIVS